MSRVAPEATAFAHRDKQGMVLIAHSEPVSVDATSLDAHILHVFQSLLPYSNNDEYVSPNAQASIQQELRENR
jgi:hypothetical protein